jgi:2,6-dihydroxypyridine 3-monooxygenase
MAAAPRVVVAGGSLGGLSAALWLRDAGCSVDVHERSRAPLEGQGAGIVLNPATVRWLVERERLEPAELGVEVAALRYLGRDGGVAAELPHAYRFTSYDTLYTRLLEAFGRDRYHLGAEVTAGRDADGRAWAVPASGAPVECEALVWADGIRSAGRRQLVPGAEGRYAGYVAWRGTLDPGDLGRTARAAFRDAITYCVLPRSHLLVYPIPASGGLLLNWLWYRNVAAGADLDALMTDRQCVRREVSVAPGMVDEQHVAGLRRDAEALPAPLAEVVAGTRAPFLQAIFDIEVPRMAFGRQCLIGDAAFALRPHAAAGSAKAAEDGYRLGRAVRAAGGDVTAALRAWEPGQLELGRRVLARTREAGQRSQFDGTWRAGDPLPFGLHEVGDSIVGGR